jgi:hypothetical protein
VLEAVGHRPPPSGEEDVLTGAPRCALEDPGPGLQTEEGHATAQAPPVERSAAVLGWLFGRPTSSPGGAGRRVAELMRWTALGVVAGIVWSRRRRVPARRCSECKVRWPETFRRCPHCKRSTTFYANASAIAEDHVDSALKHLRFEEHYATHEAERIARGDPSPEELGAEEARQLLELEAAAVDARA